jgi:phosphoribosylanthranilate isomerase
VAERALVVGVVANLAEEELRRLRDDAGLGCLQLHGDEEPGSLTPFLPHVYKAIRVADPGDVALADSYPGDHILIDAKVEGALGGTGRRVDPALVVALARRRKVTLAGGLRPENVAEAIAVVRPFAVDVASGVERPGDARRKERAAVTAFIEAVRSVVR